VARFVGEFAGRNVVARQERGARAWSVSARWAAKMRAEREITDESGAERARAEVSCVRAMWRAWRWPVSKTCPMTRCSRAWRCWRGGRTKSPPSSWRWAPPARGVLLLVASCVEHCPAEAVAAGWDSRCARRSVLRGPSAWPRRWQRGMGLEVRAPERVAGAVGMAQAVAAEGGTRGARAGACCVDGRPGRGAGRRARRGARGRRDRAPMSCAQPIQTAPSSSTTGEGASTAREPSSGAQVRCEATGSRYISGAGGRRRPSCRR